MGSQKYDSIQVYQIEYILYNDSFQNNVFIIKHYYV